MVSSPLDDHRAWRTADPDVRHLVVESVRAGLGPGWRTVRLDEPPAGALPVAVLAAPRTGTEMLLVPGGRLAMGLSEPEEEALRRALGGAIRAGTLRPVHDVAIPPFLLGRFPLLRREVASLVDLDAPWDRPSVDVIEPDLQPVLLSAGEAARAVAALRGRLPTEAEAEWAARAATATLFPWGDTPEEAGIARLHFTDYRDASRCREAESPFGVVGWAVGTFCADAWHPDYGGAPTDGSSWAGAGDRVVRGGTITSWPFQSANEWIGAISAARLPAADLEGWCGARMAMALPRPS